MNKVTISYPLKAAPFLVAGRLAKRIGLRGVGGACISKANGMARFDAVLDGSDSGIIVSEHQELLEDAELIKHAKGIR